MTDGHGQRSAGTSGAARNNKAGWLCSVALVVATGVAAAMAGSSAQAEAAKPAPQAAVDLGDVVVTARRVEENIQDVPLAVTALSQNKLDALVVDNTSDLNKLSPGLQINGCVSGSLTGGSMCQINIRGFTSTRGTAFGSIAVYFADAPGMFTSTYDLQNLQVLKGPQGTLFGDTTTGGALLYTPKKPSGAEGGFVTGELGNHFYRELTGAYENHLLDDKVRFRVAGQYRKREGYATAHYSFGGTEKVGDINQLYLRGSLVLKPFDRLENYTVALWQRDKSHGGVQAILYTDPRFFSAATRNAIPSANPTTAAAYQFFTGVAPPPGLSWSQIAASALARQTAAGPDEVWSDMDQHVDRISAGIVNQTRFDISDHFYVRNIYQVRWIPQRSGGSANYDGTDSPFLQISGFKNPGSTNAYDANFGKLDNGWKNRQWTDEVQFVGDLWDNRLQLQAGYFHRQDRAGEFFGDFPYALQSGTTQQIIQFAGIAGGNLAAATCTSPPVSAPAPCFRLNRFSRKSDAYFAQGTFAITDSLKLTAGVRRSIISEGLTQTAAFMPTLVSFTGSGGGTAVLPVPVVDPLQYANAPIVESKTPGYKSLTYSLTADWKVNDRTLVYVAHRKGFKPGGINATAALDDPLRVFKPESLKDLEVGLKTDWEIGGVTGRTNVSAYKVWYSNIQVTTRNGITIFPYMVNGGEADFHGVELETAITPTPWFTISGQVSWQHNRYTKYNEISLCSSQAWRQVAGGTCDPAIIPATTQILIDHAKGVLTIAGVPATAGRPAVAGTPAMVRTPLAWSMRICVVAGMMAGSQVPPAT
ncbi:MAG: TonB-dependent receptor [Phenylobacterium sp.]|nr:TonB-dependent receptor [Phenylobacterium sp.]